MECVNQISQSQAKRFLIRCDQKHVPQIRIRLKRLLFLRLSALHFVITPSAFELQILFGTEGVEQT
jgi:hypothetical protein